MLLIHPSGTQQLISLLTSTMAGRGCEVWELVWTARRMVFSFGPRIRLSRQKYGCFPFNTGFLDPETAQDHVIQRYVFQYNIQHDPASNPALSPEQRERAKEGSLSHWVTVTSLLSLADVGWHLYHAFSTNLFLAHCRHCSWVATGSLGPFQSIPLCYT